MRRWVQNGLAAGFILAVALTCSTGQEPKGKTSEALYYSLRDVINHGAALFNNQGDYAGCYRVYQGALIAVRPQLTEHPDLLKEIDDTLKRADAMPRIVDRAFALRTALDHVRERLRPKDLPEEKKTPEKKPEEKKPEEKKPEEKKPEEKKPPEKKPEEKKPEEKKPEEKKAATLWDRLGGEANVTRAIADFIKLVSDNPKADVTRGGKFPLDAKKTAQLERALVELISEATGGPLKYEGKSMKAAHKGMGITNTEFDAAGADLLKALQNAKIKKADIDDLMKIVDSTRKDIVEAKEEKKTEEKKSATLWDRLGGEANVTRAIADFIKLVSDNPKADVTRGGKFPLDAKKTAQLERALVELISEATGGPLKYEGKSMKAAHKGMGITNAEFDAAGADLLKALQNAKIKKADIDDLMKIVDSTRKDIVEARKDVPEEEPKKKEEKKEEVKKEEKKEKVKKEEKALPDGTGELTGKVSNAGKIGTTGYITLIGPDQRNYSTFIRADGSYVFKTPLPPGEYQIGVETFQKEGAPPLADRFPARYLNPATSGFSIRIQPGSNAFDLDLE